MSDTAGFSSIEAKSFFKSLYDFSFSSFVATRILRVLYVVLVVLYSIAAAVFLIAGIASGESNTIVFSIVAVPIGYVIYLAFLRVTFEIIMVIFRMAADLRSIAERGAAGEAQA